MKLITNSAHVIKTPENPKSMEFGEFSSYYTSPCISSFCCSSVSFIISFNKLVNIGKCSLSSVSHSSKLTESKEESLEPLICSWLEILLACDGPLKQDLGGNFCDTEHLSCGICQYLQVDSVRTQLHYRTPSWCHRELHVMGKTVTYLVIRSVRRDKKETHKEKIHSRKDLGFSLH